MTTTTTCQHRWVDYDICEKCGEHMKIATAYELAIQDLRTAMHTLEHADLAGSGLTPSDVTASIIAIDAAYEQLREDAPG